MRWCLLERGVVAPGEEHGAEDVGEFLIVVRLGKSGVMQVSISSLRCDGRRMPRGQSREVVKVFD